MLRHLLVFAVTGALIASTCGADGASRGELRQVGVAKVDVTPGYPIRLAGYASRTTESEGVAQRIWAKALVIGSDREKPAILITLDSCGIPITLRNEVAARLQRARGVDPDRVAICVTHTHSAPLAEGYLSNLFFGGLPADQVERIHRYAIELTDALEKVALQALDQRQPSRMSWGRGHAGFAANRRTKGGPVDQELPVLAITGKNGKVRALLFSYACHCTTLTGEFNQICGDWAGYAQEYLEQEHQGAVVLAAVGCGGDANPNPRPGFDLAKQHGREIATSVESVLTNKLAAINGELVCRTRRIELPFDTLPTRAEWEEKAKEPSHVGQHAKAHLQRLDRGEPIKTKLPYLVQTWSFGDTLGMVFLPGEVVVDYSHRLKRESAPGRVWVNAYANDVPCYIPSERVLSEGGYEGGGAMIYYDQPTRFAPGLENHIIGTVQDLLPRKLGAVYHRPSP